MMHFNTILELSKYLEIHNLEVYKNKGKKSYLRNVDTKEYKEIVITNFS